MKLDTENFRSAIITRRKIIFDSTIEETAKKIGISKATLSRLENSKMPDLLTYCKVCKWLGVDYSKYIKHDVPSRVRQDQ